MKKPENNPHSDQHQDDEDLEHTQINYMPKMEIKSPEKFAENRIKTMKQKTEILHTFLQNTFQEEANLNRDNSSKETKELLHTLLEDGENGELDSNKIYNDYKQTYFGSKEYQITLLDDIVKILDDPERKQESVDRLEHQIANYEKQEMLLFHLPDFDDLEKVSQAAKKERTSLMDKLVSEIETHGEQEIVEPRDFDYDARLVRYQNKRQEIEDAKAEDAIRKQLKEKEPKSSKVYPKIKAIGPESNPTIIKQQFEKLQSNKKEPRYQALELLKTSGAYVYEDKLKQAKKLLSMDPLFQKRAKSGEFANISSVNELAKYIRGEKLAESDRAPEPKKKSFFEKLKFWK